MRQISQAKGQGSKNSMNDGACVCFVFLGFSGTGEVIFYSIEEEYIMGIINFLTGPLNTFAWLYVFLPFAVGGGLYLTIRNRGLQFGKFGYAMRNTVGRMFRKQEAGEGP